MSITIAIVVNVTGNAWAEAPDGSRRLLQPGDALMLGERLITADDGRVTLDFGYNNEATVDSGVSILASAELANNFVPAATDNSLEDSSVEQALAAIEDALGSSLDDIEAPAAGIDGGSAGGSSSVRLARIVENINGADISLNLQSLDSETPLINDGDVTTGSTAEAQPLPGSIAIDNVSPVTGDSNNLIVNGNSSNLLAGNSIIVTVTDQNGNSVSQTVTAGPDGKFTSVISQFPNMVDGPITVGVSAQGSDGNLVSATTEGTLDLVAGSVSVTSTITDDSGQTLGLDGTTTDIAPGSAMTIVVTDSNNNSLTTTATVGDDGSFSLTGVDISGLVDGDLAITVTGEDRNGNAVTDSASGSFDATAGALTVSLDTVDNTAQTANLSGTTTDVAPNEQVAITITDSAGNVVTATTTVGADGSYSLTGIDISSLVDGALTIEAAAQDRNGNAITDSATGTVDATAGALSVTVASVDNVTQTIDLTGTTNDVAPSSQVNVTITDSAGNVVNTTTTVGADGAYTLTGVDISSLVDGNLTVEASAQDRNGNAVADSATDSFDATAGDLTVVLGNVDNDTQTIDLSGTSTDVAPNSQVDVTISDSAGNTVTATATVGADGSYTLTGVDISSLVDGDLTVEASAQDRNGNAVTDSATGSFDATAGDLSVTIANLDNGTQTIDLSGTTTDVAPNEQVDITITDSAGNVVNAIATVGADGSFSLTGVDISSLVDGSLTVDASAQDRNGNAVTDSANGTFDATTGDLTVAIANVDNGTQTIDLSGTSTDLAPNSQVDVTITDSAGNVVNATATVGADGSYSLTGVDIASLVDGNLTVEASAQDRNGNAVSDSANGAFDATGGALTVSVDTIDNTAQTVNLSGTTTDVAPNDQVSITVTDSAGNVVTATTTVGADGSYSLTGIDISSLVDGNLTVEAAAQDRNGNAVSDSANGAFDATGGALTVSIDTVDSAAQTANLSGTTSDVAPNGQVAIAITDSAGNIVNATATVGADGSYSLTGVDISSLVDGDLTVEASAQDRNGNALTDSANGALDATAGDLTVSVGTIDNTAQTANLSGTTTDVAPNEQVAITITDSAGNAVNATATVGADGSYTLTGVDISGLVDGNLTVEATAQDRNGNAVSDSATGTVDATAGDLTVVLGNVDNGTQTIDLSGTTTDVAPNEQVSITVTDSAGNVVNAAATVAADGSYSLSGVDISSLVDGNLTVEATAQDRNGNAVSDSANGTFDATAGDLTVVLGNVDNGTQTIDLSGTTTDVAPNEQVSITVTDSAGNVVNTTATVGADGSYTLTGVDISSLVDGALTIEAAAQDRNGNAITDSATGTVDATAGALSVTVASVDNVTQTIDLTGTTNDVAPSSQVNVTITDSAGNVVNTTTTVGADGAYTLTGVDISSLVDGNLTVEASAQDRNGNAVSDSANGTFDATAGALTVSVDTVDNTAQTVNLSGTTTDVAPNGQVAITMTDSAGNIVNATATVGTDGSYTLTGVDISSLVDGDLTVEAAAQDRNGNAVSDSANGTFDATAGDLTVSVDTVDSTAQTANLSGTTTDVAPNEQVSITVTDSAGNVVNAAATVAADGSYSLSGVDISSLVDGNLTVEATAQDRNGNAVSDSAAGSLDATTGALTVSLDTVDNAAQTVDLSGTTADVAPNSQVNVTITDSTGNVVNATATVGADGSYSLTGVDISSLVDGDLTVEASAQDRNGNALTDSANGALDATAGDLTVSVGTIDNTAQTANLSGTTTDVAPNEQVAITITDSAGNAVTATTTVGADGSYTLTGIDISSLVDGNLSVEASAQDRNGNALTDSANGAFDATAGDLTVSVDTVDSTAQTANLSGTTTDVALNSQVDLTVTDSAGNVVTATTTVGADGSYSLSGVDISSLVDGNLTVEATAQDRNGNAVSDSAAGSLDATTGALTVSLDTVDNAAQTVDLSGTTADVAPNSQVNVTITDSTGNVVNATATVGADGSYTLTGVDISSLVDGNLSVDASAQDRNGNTVSDSATGSFDATAGDLAVTISNVDNGAQTIDLSGTTTDVAPNSQVNVTITDSAGNVVNAIATVGADGAYTLTGVDISSLVDGDLTVEASAQDRNGNAVSDSVTGSFDATTGALTVSIDTVDNAAQTANLSGTTTDVAPDSEITITITDSANNVVNTTATVGADGSYALSGLDISNLENGQISVSATTTDRNGQALSDSDTGVLDTNITPDAQSDSFGEVAIPGLFGEYFAYSQGTNGDGKNLASISQVEEFIAANEADATFIGTKIDYGSISGNLGGNGKLQAFLGTDDASSLSNDPENSSDAIVKMSGNLALEPGDYQFRVLADDGFKIEVNGQPVVFFDGNQSAITPTTGTFTIAGDGPHTVEIVYWDQGWDAQLRVEIREQGGQYETFGSQHVTHDIGTPGLIVDEDQSLEIDPATLLSNDSDPNGDPLTVQSVQDATHGTVSITADGKILFTPDAHYNGPASFTYTISDGRGGTDTATVELLVKPVNDVPTTTEVDLGSVVEDGSILITQDMLAAGIEDADAGDTVSVENLSVAPGDGSLVDNLDGTWTFTPAADLAGEIELSYDYTSGTDTGSNTASVTVTAQADAPSLAFDDAPVSGVDGTPEADLPVSTGLLLNFYDNLNNSTRNAASQEQAIGDTPATESSRVVDGFGTPKEQTSGQFQNDGSTIEVKTGDSFSVTGLIYLEAGRTYQFQGYRDDSLRIELGGKTLVSTTGDSWGNYGPNISSNLSKPFAGESLTPTESGFYTLETYVNNVSGPGQFSLNLVVDGQPPQELSAQNFYIYSSVSDLVAVGGQFGAFQSGTDNSDGGYFPLVINSGTQNNYIEIANIAASVADTDGSESIVALNIAGIPAGAVLTDGNHSFLATSGLTEVNVLGWNLDNIQILPPSDFTGTFDLIVTATSEELSNADQASTSQAITVTVQAPEDLLGAIDPDQIGTDSSQRGTADNDTLTADGGDNIILAGDGNDTVNALAGNDSIDGGVGDDSLYGGEGSDIIHGGAGDDILDGGAGNDLLAGEDGNDQLFGGLGADVFRWELSDGAVEEVPRDVVVDFTIDDTNGFNSIGEGDQLDLSDLLRDADPESINDYLVAQEEGGSTVILVDSDGTLGSGTDNVSQSIVLSGVSMDGQTSEQFIDSLLNNHQIKIE